MPTTFHEKITLLRTHENMTLHALAQACQLTLKQLNGILRKPQSTDQTATIERVFHALTEVDEGALKKLLDEVFAAILYLDYAKVLTLNDQLISLESAYRQSHLYGDYLIILFASAIHTEDVRIDPYSLYQVLAKVAPFEDDFLQELLDVEWAAYHYLKGHTKEFLSHLKPRMHRFKDERLKAFAHYLFGSYFGQNYDQISQALISLQVAQQAFEQQANYARSNQAKVVLQRLYFYNQNMQEYHQLYRQTWEYGHRHRQPRTINYMEETTIRAHIILGEIDNAFSLLEHRMYESSEKYFLALYCSYMLNMFDFMSLHYPSIPHHLTPFLSPRLEEGLHWLLDYGLQTHPSQKAQQNIIRYFDHAVREKDYFFVVVYARMAVDVLKRSRRYKDAFNIMQTWMSIELKVK